MARHRRQLVWGRGDPAAGGERGDLGHQTEGVQHRGLDLRDEELGLIKEVAGLSSDALQGDLDRRGGVQFQVGVQDTGVEA